MTVEIRPVADAEIEAYVGQLTRVFSGSSPLPGTVDSFRRVVEVDRTLAGFEDGRMVATAGIHTFTMTLPGGATGACAGVTRVSVLPTHRRRGILSALMRRQLDDVHGRGEPLAALYASQAPIYGRFGYGVGTWHTHLGIDRGRARIRAAALPAEAAFELLDREQATGLAESVHSVVARRHPGAVHRTRGFWKHAFEDLPENRHGASELNHVGVRTSTGEGFASYRLRRRWQQGEPSGTVEVGRLLATEPGAELALWRYCASIDLTTRVEADDRRVDEPLRLALVDARALRVGVRDGIWIRLVDVAAALAARRYSAPGRLRVRVHDDLCKWNDGVFELEAEAGGVARCERSQGAADLELDVADLAAAYLGANSFTRLAAARLVAGADAGMARADAMFATTETPWCPTHF